MVVVWDLDAARRFVDTAGRLLDQRLFAVLFDGGDPGDVVAALLTYRNADGGFGHGLEPDKLAPASQPLDVEIAFDHLTAAGASASEIVASACDWIETVADASGAVPILLPTIVGHPRAAHFANDRYPAGVNPTAAIAAHAHALGAEHAWVERATEYCLAEIEADRAPAEAHDLLCLTKLLAAVPDHRRAERLAPVIRSALDTASFMNFAVDAASYGLTPLEFAPSPASFAHGWFLEDHLADHLDALEDGQQPDGGWPITWEPPPGSEHAWRAIRTVVAARTLRAYGR